MNLMKNTLSDSELESVTGGNQIEIQLDTLPTLPDRQLPVLPPQPKIFRKLDDEPSETPNDPVWRSTYVKGEPGTGKEYKFAFDETLFNIERNP